MKRLVSAILLIFAPAAPCRPQNAPGPTPTEVKGDPSIGKKLFENQCALCHGIDGGGGRGPNIRRPKLDHAADDAALRALIQNGIAPEMSEGWFLSSEDIANLAAYANPVSFNVDGKQRVAIAADRVLYVFGMQTTNQAKKLAGAEGFEPSPSSLTVRCPTSWTTPQRAFFALLLPGRNTVPHSIRGRLRRKESGEG